MFWTKKSEYGHAIAVATQTLIAYTHANIIEP